MNHKYRTALNVYLGVGVCECDHSSLKVAGKDALLCQARTMARRLHVLSQ